MFRYNQQSGLTCGAIWDATFVCGGGGGGGGGGEEGCMPSELMRNMDCKCYNLSHFGAYSVTKCNNIVSRNEMHNKGSQRPKLATAIGLTILCK